MNTLQPMKLQTQTLIYIADRCLWPNTTQIQNKDLNTQTKITKKINTFLALLHIDTIAAQGPLYHTFTETITQENDPIPERHILYVHNPTLLKMVISDKAKNIPAFIREYKFKVPPAWLGEYSGGLLPEARKRVWTIMETLHLSTRPYSLLSQETKPVHIKAQPAKEITHNFFHTQ
jgi:hypothetical protein